MHLRVRDLGASRRFYEGAVGPLGREVGAGDGGVSLDALVVSEDDEPPAGLLHGPVERSAESVVFSWDDA